MTTQPLVRPKSRSLLRPLFRRLRRAGRDDRGTVIPLICAYLLVVSLLLLVVVDATMLFLNSRALGTLADGAALAAAQEINKDTLYNGSTPVVVDLPLLESGARQAAVDYLDRTGATARYPGYQLAVVVTAAGNRVQVVIRAAVKVPFTNLLSTADKGGLPLTGSADAVLRCDTVTGGCN